MSFAAAHHHHQFGNNVPSRFNAWLHAHSDGDLNLRASPLNERNGSHVYHIERLPIITADSNTRYNDSCADTEDLFDMVLDSDSEATDASFYGLGQNELIADSVASMKAWLMARGYCTP